MKSKALTLFKTILRNQHTYVRAVHGMQPVRHIRCLMRLDRQNHHCAGTQFLRGTGMANRIGGSLTTFAQTEPVKGSAGAANSDSPPRMGKGCNQRKPDCPCPNQSDSWLASGRK
ncbi:hypothetical protein AA18895_1156 [Acetobacter ghanensis DSM 18895]|nr:hypothetical protein AA18895_1156 [Acetobacter ghanensis DSM 18895]